MNPVLALDVLSEAVEKTQYVWLSQLEAERNAMLSMSGKPWTSLNAIADFYADLENTWVLFAISISPTRPIRQGTSRFR